MKLATCWLRYVTRAQASAREWIVYSRRSSQPRKMAWEWDWPLAAHSLKAMAADCGPRPIRLKVLRFLLHSQHLTKVIHDCGCSLDASIPEAEMAGKGERKKVTEPSSYALDPSVALASSTLYQGGPRPCFAEWETQACTDEFAPGKHPAPDRVLIETLLSAFDSVVAARRQELGTGFWIHGDRQTLITTTPRRILCPP